MCFSHTRRIGTKKIPLIKVINGNCITYIPNKIWHERTMWEWIQVNLNFANLFQCCGHRLQNLLKEFMMCKHPQGHVIVARQACTSSPTCNVNWHLDHMRTFVFLVNLKHCHIFGLWLWTQALAWNKSISTNDK